MGPVVASGAKIGAWTEIFSLSRGVFLSDYQGIIFRSPEYLHPNRGGGCCASPSLRGISFALSGQTFFSNGLCGVLLTMKLSNQSEVPVYTISGSNTARPLPEWLARRRKRSLKNDPEYANRVELLQDFEFEEASQCIRVSEDGDWVMSTGAFPESRKAFVVCVEFPTDVLCRL